MWLYRLGIFLLLSSGSLALQSDKLSSELEEVYSDPAFQRAFWGIKILNLETGQTVFEKNPDKLFMPASNMKLVTAVAAMELLGADFTFKTRLVSDSRIKGSRLDGDLLLIGSGDPTLGARLTSPDLEELKLGDPLGVFREMAKKLRRLGLKRIDGDIVGDDGLFDPVRLGSGWSWDYLQYGYAAGISALQFNEGVVLAEIIPSNGVEPPQIRLIPETSQVTTVNQLESCLPGDDFEFSVERRPGDEFVFRGRIPSGSEAFFQSLAVENPTEFFLKLFRETLEKEGIEIRGRVVSRSSQGRELDGEAAEILVHESPDLRFILRVLLKISQNLYAETLVRVLDPHESGKSFEGGRREIERVLTRAGIPPDAYRLADGSGLSRYNLLSPEALVRLLRHVYLSDYRDEFIELLPIAAVDGTIENRMKRTLAADNVKAKTGTIAYVRALSGYVWTAEGQPHAFSMIVNHYTQPRRSADYLLDLVLQRIASSSEKSQLLAD